MFSEWLEVRMRAAGLTEKELAAQIGISQQAVSRWQLGLAKPAGQRLGRLATALGVGAEVVVRELEKDDISMRLPPTPSKDRSLESQVHDLQRRLNVVERLLAERSGGRPKAKSR